MKRPGNYPAFSFTVRPMIFSGLPINRLNQDFCSPFSEKSQFFCCRPRQVDKGYASFAAAVIDSYMYLVFVCKVHYLDF